MSLWRRILVERRRTALPLLALVVINIAVLALGVFPLRQSVASDRAAGDAATLALVQAHRLEKSAQMARDSREQADRELKKFYAQVLPAGAADARHLTYQELQKMAADSGLVIINGTMEDAPLKDSQLSKLTWKATFTGGYVNIRRFLYAVETAPQFIAVEDVLLEQQPNSTQGQSGVLRVTFDIATYFLR